MPQNNEIAKNKNVCYYDIMNQSPTVVYNRILDIERELELLKVATFFRLPKKQTQGKYPMKEIIRTVQKTRSELRQERYAGKL